MKQLTLVRERSPRSIRTELYSVRVTLLTYLLEKAAHKIAKMHHYI